MNFEFLDFTLHFLSIISKENNHSVTRIAISQPMLFTVYNLYTMWVESCFRVKVS